MTANTELSVNNRLIKKFPLLDSIMNCRGHRYNQRSFKIHPCPLRRFFNVEINSILCSTSLNFFKTRLDFRLCLFFRTSHSLSHRLEFYNDDIKNACFAKFNNLLHLHSQNLQNCKQQPAKTQQSLIGGQHSPQFIRKYK